MVNEKELWIKRRSDYWTMAIRYLKLIGNSGFLFTIYLLFVFGSYYYGQFLEWLPETFPATLFFTIFFTWLITRGRVRTFAKPGDLFFLTPREGKMNAYFQSSIVYSWMMETLYVSLVLLVLAPLFFERVHPSGTLLLSILLLLSGLKLWNLASGFEEQRIQDQFRYNVHTLLRLGLNAVAVYALFSLQPIWLLGIIIIALLIFYMSYYHKLSKSFSLKWDRLVQIEDSTVMTFYRIANSFTDVPALQSKVRPRQWLSPLFRLVSYNHKHVYRYLFSRAFVRSNDYFGIYIRLSLLCILFISIVQLDWGRWLIVALFTYMTALQLETLKHHFETVQMVEVYPISNQEKLNSHQFWVVILGVIQGGILGIFTLVTNSFTDGVVVLLIAMIVYAYHARIRLPKRYSHA